MYLYNENKEKFNYILDNQNIIGEGEYGIVYKLNYDTCLKLYYNNEPINRDILSVIRNLKLQNYYRIYAFLYDYKSNFKAHTMKYYKQEQLDILTMPTIYTLNNLFNLLMDIDTLNKNNILISDMHTGNVILGYSEITIIDADLYKFNNLYRADTLKYKNLSSLGHLLEQIYLEALTEYHSELKSKEVVETIKNLFQFQNKFNCEEPFRMLEKYYYPIDYIKRRIKIK